jgi:hypothetical protein
MSKKAIVSISNIILGNVKSRSDILSTKAAQCINAEATSARLRCSLVSNLMNVKSVNKVTFDFGQVGITGYNSEIKMHLNTEYLFSPNSADVSQSNNLIFLDYKGVWYVHDTTLDSQSFESEKISNNNVLDAIIPPSSCFNMKMHEVLTKITIVFTATATTVKYDSNGDREGSSVSSIEGELEANVIGLDRNEIKPCDAA